MHVKLANYFCVSLDYLIGRSDDPLSFDFLLESAQSLANKESLISDLIPTIIKEIKYHSETEENLFMKLSSLRKFQASWDFSEKLHEDENLLDEDEKHLLKKFQTQEEDIVKMLFALRQQNIDKMHERFYRYKPILERIDKEKSSE